MRFAILILTSLLTHGLLSAQDPTPVEPPQPMDEPEPQHGETVPGDGPAGRPGTIQELRGIGLHGLDVEVLQDPIRIAPGERGHLILLVRIPRGRMIESGGEVVMKSRQGPMTLGKPAWDPLPKGKSVYTDVLVIKVPLSIDAKAPFGKPMFQGSLRLRGTFQGMGPDGMPPGLMGDGSPQDPEAPRQGVRAGLDPNRATLDFQRLIHIGPPMPKASGNHRKRGGRKGSPVSGKAGPGQSPKAGAKPVVAGPSDAVPGLGPARTGSRREQGQESSDHSEEGLELSEEKAEAFPWWILSLGLVILAALVFAAQAKKA